MKKKKSTKSKGKFLDILVTVICVAGISVALFYFYKDYSISLSNEKSEPVGAIYFKKNSAQRRFETRNLWERLKVASPVYDGDRIRTGSLSEAYAIMNDGSRIEIHENTLIQIFSGEVNTVHFSTGSISVSSSTSESVEIMSGDKLITLSENSSATISIPKTESEKNASSQSEESVGQNPENKTFIRNAAIQVSAGKAEIQDVKPDVQESIVSRVIPNAVKKRADDKKDVPSSENKVQTVSAGEIVNFVATEKTEPVAEKTEPQNPIKNVVETVKKIPQRNSSQSNPIQRTENVSASNGNSPNAITPLEENSTLAKDSSPERTSTVENQNPLEILLPPSFYSVVLQPEENNVTFCWKNTQSIYVEFSEDPLFQEILSYKALQSSSGIEKYELPENSKGNILYWRATSAVSRGNYVSGAIELLGEPVKVSKQVVSVFSESARENSDFEKLIFEPEPNRNVAINPTRVTREQQNESDILAAEERFKAENEAIIAEEKRKAEEEAKVAEENRIAQEQAKLEEEIRKSEAEEQARLAEEKRKADEAARLAEEKRKADEAARIAEEKRKADEAARIAEEKRKADEAARLAEEKRKADEAARIAEEKRKADEAARIAEEKRKADEAARIAEEKRKADEAARLAEEKRKADEAARLAEEKRKAEEEARLAEERRKAEEQARIAEEIRKAEQEARLAEEKRKLEEEARLAEEKRKAEEAARLAEERRKAEEQARIAEEIRKAEQEARLAEEKRKADEEARLAEEKRKAEETARLAEEKRKAEEKANSSAKVSESKNKTEKSSGKDKEVSKTKTDEVAQKTAEKKDAENTSSKASESSLLSKEDIEKLTSATPKLKSPSNKKSYSDADFAKESVPSIKFSWEKVDVATYYEFELKNMDGKLLLKKSVKENSYTLDKNISVIAETGTYFWTVTAKAKNGAETVSSKTSARSFSIVLDDVAAPSVDKSNLIVD